MLLKIHNEAFTGISFLNIPFTFLRMALVVFLFSCNQGKKAKDGYAYYCPPCNAGHCDTTAFQFSGECPVCKMPLIEKQLISKNTVNKASQ
jgi:hypothetical protein